MSCKKSYTCTCAAATQSNGFNTFQEKYTIKERKKDDAIEACSMKTKEYDHLIGTQQSYGTVMFINCNID